MPRRRAPARGSAPSRQDHEVEIAEGRHLAAPGAAQADQGDASAGGWSECVTEIVSQADDLVVQEGGRPRGRAAVARLVGQPPRDFRAAAVKRLAEDFRRLRRASYPGQRCESVANRPAVDDRSAVCRPRGGSSALLGPVS